MCDVEARRAECLAGGVERAVIAPSPALGIELLPPDEAASVLAAWHGGVVELGAPFSAWAGVGLVEADPGELEARLDEGFVGLCLAAGCLADPREADRVGGLLEVLQRRGRPLFVHPGPAATVPDPAYPAWWPALTRYVAEMHAAWHGTAVFVRPHFPTLRICFAMLAGLAPAHTERRASRGLHLAPDPHAFYDTSSYGPRACEAVIAAVGAERLVHGTDRPMAPPRPAGGDPALTALVGGATPRLLLDDPEARA